MDIAQPPGIGIPPIPDMEPHQTIVTTALAAKSSAETTSNPFRDCGTQRAPYSSWRRHQMPLSLRPLGARSSH